MPTFGIHAFTLNGEWNNDIGPATIKQAAELGFDLLEIPLLRPDEFDAAKIHKALKDNHLKAVTSLALPPHLHTPHHPKEALKFLKLAADKTAAIEGTKLAGCLYCNLGMMTNKPPSHEERDTIADVIGQLEHYAKPKGIQIGIEPVNRYETYLYNVGSDVADLIHQIGSSDMFIHFDTYHMNIEENGFSDPIKKAGKLCQYIHMSESNRGIPGEGNVDWDDTFVGLKAIGYQGPLVLEAFAAVNPDLQGATKLWRLGDYSGKELAIKGMAFLREKAAKHGLN